MNSSQSDETGVIRRFELGIHAFASILVSWFYGSHQCMRLNRCNEAGKSYSHGDVNAHVHALPKPGPWLGPGLG